MFAKERHAKILEALKLNGTVTTAQLTDEFNVSVETVRRDLLQLEKQGKLQRVHGGAMPFSEMKAFEELPVRIEDNKENKTELCETAARLVKDGDIIAIDSGSTAVYLSEALKEKLSRLTVITHSTDVFEILNTKDGFNVILCGGVFNKSERAFYGQLAVDTLKKLYVSKAFIFPSAVSLKSGIWDFNQDLMQMQLQMLSNAERVFILADSDKFEKNALIKLCDMSPNFTYVTDSKLSPRLKQLYKDEGFNIICSKEEV